MRRLVVTCVTAAFVVAACGSSGSTSSSTSTSGASRTTTTTTGPTGSGTTAWVDVTAQWRAMTPSSLATNPQQAAEDLAAIRRGQDTSEVGEVSVEEVRTGEPAVVVLAETGGADPAVAKLETEITLEPGEGGWAVATARQRATCFRAPTSPDATTCPPVG